jgi:predicted neuraminidase
MNDGLVGVNSQNFCFEGKPFYGIKGSLPIRNEMHLIRYALLIFCSFFFPASAEIVEELVFENPPFASCHASTIAETSSGKLLCAYFAGTEEGAKDVGIWLSTRTTKGWGAPRLIAEDSAVPCWNPVLFTAPSGEILLFYKVGPRPSSWSGAIKRSHDEGHHWTKEELLPAGVLGPVKNKPLLLKDGTLLCGSSIETWRRWGCWIDLTKDGGKTWTKSSPINLKGDVFGIIQPTLFWGPSGKVCLLARSYDTGTICSAVSEDEGRTWTGAVPIDLPNPNAAIDAVRLEEGPIVLVYNSSTERTPLNLAISKDGGVKWEPSLVLEDTPGEYSYPSIIQTPDHRIHITYTYNRTHIKYVSLEPSDLLNPGSKAK